MTIRDLTVLEIKEQKDILNSKRELKKHVATIHCSNTLSLLQRKISNALLYNAYNDLQTKDSYQITVKQLAMLIGCNTNNHVVIKNAIKGLISTVLEWNVIDEVTGEEDWSASSLLACVRIQGSLCTYSYSPRMRELLYSPSVYGKINLIIQSKFKSNYGLALYENCVRYRSLPFTKWFDISLFRTLMGVFDDKYTIFRDFKKRVLDKAIDEVNTYSDLYIEPEMLRQGRGEVVRIRFKLEEKVKKVPLGVNLVNRKKIEKIDDKLIARLVAVCNISPTLTQKLINEYGRSLVEEKLLYVEQLLKINGNKIDNPAGYLINTLKSGSEAKQANALLKYEMQESLEQQNLITKLSKKYDKYLAEQIVMKISHMPDEDEKQSIIDSFQGYLSGMFLTLFKKEGFNNILILDKFVEYVKEKNRTFCDNFLSFQEFCSQDVNASK